MSGVRVHLDATHCATKGGRSGIPRMVRELARALRDAGAAVEPVVWDQAAGEFLRPHAFHLRNLDPAPRRLRRTRAVVPLRQKLWNALTRPFRRGAEQEFAGGWVVLAETFPDGRAGWAERHEPGRGPFRLAAIFHDAIGHTHPEWIPAQNRQRFSAYLASLSRCDLVACISRQSQDDLERFWAEHSLPPAPTRVLHWPASGVVSRRKLDTDGPAVDGPFLLCVASLEPRKNHLALLRACRTLWEEGSRFTLVLAGQRLRSGSDEIAAEIEALRGAGFPLVWQGEIDDLLLASLYRDCLFTVYPSLKEGFGLPILESLGFGKACVCHREGAIAEAAEGGGCLQIDVADPAALAGALRTLLNDPAALKRLEAEAAARPLRTWGEWAGDFLRLLKEAEKA